MHRRAARLLAALPLLAVAPATSAASPSAPLGIRTQGTFRELFLDLPLADARGPTGPELDARWSVANDWSTPTVVARGTALVLVQTDEQADALGVSVRLPWARPPGASGATRTLAQRLSSTLELRLTEHWGGWTDGPIDAWHRLVRSFDFDRPLYPRDRVRVRLAELGGASAVDASGAVLAMGDLAIRNQVLLLEGGASAREPGRAAWAVAARLDVKVPLGRLSSLGGSQGWDAGAGVAGTVELAPWLVGHAMVALSAWSGLPGGLPLQPRTWHASFDASLAARAGPVTLLLEDRLLTPAFESGWVLAAGGDPRSTAYNATFRAHNQVSGGVRWGPVTLWLSEDFTPGTTTGVGAAGWFYDSNAPDLCLGVAVLLPL